MLNVANIVKESIVDGDGIRYVIFTQGCPHHCNNCHNASTWTFTENQLIDINDIIEEVKKNPLLDGITLSGGEPFMQAKELVKLVKQIHSLNLNVWCFTGFTYEELLNSNNIDYITLINSIDFLVDGKYIDAERNLALKFRGSTNQRVIDVKKSSLDNIVLKYTD